VFSFSTMAVWMDTTGFC